MSVDTGPAAGALSTQPTAPTPPPAGRVSPLVAVRRAWRQLTSMRTALLLLVLLAAAAIPGSIIPQHSLAPSQVARFQAQHPTLTPIYNRLSLFDVFHAPWFAAIYALLFISLIGCVIPRMRLHARALTRRPPAAPRHLGRLPQSARWETDLPADQVVAITAKMLRRKRFRVASRDGSDTAAGKGTAAGVRTVSAEKGYLRETGNLLFHLSLIILLVGIGTGSLFGYQGEKLLIDGSSFTNSRLYDTFKSGALTDPASLSPFTVKLDQFDATYQPDGQAATFDAHVSSTTAAGMTSQSDLRVNHPLTFGQARVYLIGHGYAIHVLLRDRTGKVLHDETVPCIPQDLVDYLSDCVVKAPDTGGTIPTAIPDPATGKSVTVDKPLQFGFLINFVPTAELDLQRGILSTFPGATRPRVLVTAYTGDLGLGSGVPQSVYQLDTAALHLKPVVLPPAQQIVTPGDAKADTIDLPQGFTLQIAGYTQWASLQVKDDPAKGVTLVAAALIVIGLLLSLRVRRRRVWLRATPAAGGRTIVEAGGLARTDADDFAREFPTLVARLAGEITPASTDRSADPAVDPAADPAARPDQPPGGAA